MKPFLTRDEQIQMMETAQKRQQELLSRVLTDPLVRKIVSTPPSIEDEASVYSHTDRPTARMIA